MLVLIQGSPCGARNSQIDIQGVCLEANIVVFDYTYYYTKLLTNLSPLSAAQLARKSGVACIFILKSTTTIYLYIVIFTWHIVHKTMECTFINSHYLFCTMNNKCTIISQIITLPHVSTLPCQLYYQQLNLKSLCNLARY